MTPIQPVVITRPPAAYNRGVKTSIAPLTLALVLVLVSAACGGSGHRHVPVTYFGAVSLLNQLALPPGAQRLRVAPRGDGGLLRHAQTIPGGSQLDLHRIWRVHRAYSSTTSFVLNRLPPDAQGQGRGASGGPGIPYNNESDDYSLPTGDDTSVFWLDLTFVALPLGWTGIRADALLGSCPCIQH